ncbi:hypothetical protein LIA77_02057 [Sarocladium implicatum]|nr:hypothetical protein LIA77_02057 [Sarocladium implicatum]
MASLAAAALKPRKSLSKRSLLAKPFKISQLDGSAPRRAEIRVIKRKASVELIAEQYQAFLESRDAEEESHAGHEEFDDDEATPTSEEAPMLLLPTRFDPDAYRAEMEGRNQERDFSPSASPASSVCTLVDFEAVEAEQDVIYFKPVSFPSRSNRSRSDSQGCDKPLPMPPPTVEPLQTCVSLVVEDMATKFPTSPHPASLGAGGYEINTMIEVYERVREQLNSSELGYAEQKSVRAMFDCWLAALHTMHHRSYAAGKGRVFSEQPLYRRPRPSGHIYHQRGMSAGVL